MQSSSCSLKVKSIDIVIFCLYNWAAFLREMRKQWFISFFYLFYQYTVSYFSSINCTLVDLYILSFIQFERLLLSHEPASQSLAGVCDYNVFAFTSSAHEKTAQLSCNLTSMKIRIQVLHLLLYTILQILKINEYWNYSSLEHCIQECILKEHEDK